MIVKCQGWDQLWSTMAITTLFYYERKILTCNYILSINEIWTENIRKEEENLVIEYEYDGNCK